MDPIVSCVLPLGYCCEIRSNVYTIRGQSNLTKSASRGAHSPVMGHPRGSKVVPLNSWGRGFLLVFHSNYRGLGCTVWPQCTRVTTNQRPTSSSSRMRVIYHNWSAMKQRPHPQSVAEIRHHSVLSGGRIRQCETSSGSRHKDTDQCL